MLNTFVQGQRWGTEEELQVICSDVNGELTFNRTYNMLQQVKEKKLNVIQTYYFGAVFKDPIRAN